MENHEVTPFTCPTCHALLTAVAAGASLAFRCPKQHQVTGDEVQNGLATERHTKIVTNKRIILVEDDESIRTYSPSSLKEPNTPYQS